MRVRIPSGYIHLMLLPPSILPERSGLEVVEVVAWLGGESGQGRPHMAQGEIGQGRPWFAGPPQLSS